MRELDYGKMGMRIRQVRKAKGWSQSALAEKCGISMSFLGHIERGSRIMSMETFANICMALDVGADELLWGVAAPSEAVLDMWNLPGRRKEQKGGKPKVQKEQENQKAQEAGRMPDELCRNSKGRTGGKEGSETGSGKMDSYEMYVKIMKSVAEIMNGA